MRLVVRLFILLACSACAFGLDRSLDVSQYAHTAWKIRDGFTKGTIFSMAQTPDGYLWLGTEFGLVRFDGARAVPWQPPAGEQLPSKWIQASFGCARRHSLDCHREGACQLEGRQADRIIRKLPGPSLLHCWKIPKERFGLESGTPAGSVPSEPARRSATEPGVSAGPYPPYTRTTKAICGSRLKRVCGDGRLVLQSTTHFPVAQLRPRR